MQEKPKKKLRLTRKQFIIGIVTICGIALVIEAVLLVRMFTKNRENAKGNEAGKNPESFIRKVYIQEGSDGEEELDSIEQFDYASDGQLYHEYKWDITYYRGDPYILAESVEVYYSYDKRGRLIGENRETIRNYPHPQVNSRYEEKRIVSYEYKEGEPLEVFIQSADEDGNPDYTVEEKYNDAGICIARTRYEYFGGTPEKTEEITYNDIGDILSAVYVRINKDGEIRQTDKKTYSYYESGTKKTSSEQSFDKDGLMKEWTETKYNEYGVEIVRSRLEKGDLVPVLVYDENERKSGKTSHTYNEDKTEEWLFDEKGRMNKRANQTSQKITDEKTADLATEEEFFYSEKGEGPTVVRTTYKRVANGRVRETIETTYDSSGRILQSNTVSKDGEETKVLYDWNYRDLSHPSRDVMRMEVYQNGNRIQETLYRVYPVVKEEQAEWCWPYGEFDRCRHNDRYNQEGCYLLSMGFCEVCEDYITSVGQYHLEPYHDEVYDPETGSRSVRIESSFDIVGRIKTLLYLEDDNRLHIWEFDDHGNLILAEHKWNGESMETVRCEYTYYTAQPEAVGR